jgi:metal-dependent amidase/aminoacylase/carboxypeptidase family protein
MNAEWRKNAQLKIREICESTAKGMGGQCDVDIQSGYPMVENDKHITLKAMEYARDILGEENIIQLDPQMTAEDFAYFAQLAPATFFRLGTDDLTGKYSSPLHSPEFGVDERAIKTGMGLLSWLAISFLNEKT